jgi:succinoglycan biosynthesis protein ExoM
MRPVAVIIPTLRRPESLARAVASVQRQLRADELIREIVVVDNAPEGSAAPVVELARAASPVAMVYAHAPRPWPEGRRCARWRRPDHRLPRR